LVLFVLPERVRKSLLDFHVLKDLNLTDKSNFEKHLREQFRHILLNSKELLGLKATHFPLLQISPDF